MPYLYKLKKAIHIKQNPHMHTVHAVCNLCGRNFHDSLSLAEIMIFTKGIFSTKIFLLL